MALLALLVILRTSGESKVSKIKQQESNANTRIKQASSTFDAAEIEVSACSQYHGYTTADETPGVAQALGV